MVGLCAYEQWYDVIGDNTLADAILDRLMHNAHRMNLQGENMRKKMNSLTQVEHLEPYLRIRLPIETPTYAIDLIKFASLSEWGAKPKD